MKVGYLQFNPVFGEKERNLKRISDFLAECGDADLIVVPELCATGYGFKIMDELSSAAESIPNGKTTSMFIRMAKQNGIYLIAGIAERDDGKFYNSAVLVGPDGFYGKYRKIHLFNEEKDLFTPGNFDLPVFEVKRTRIGIMICFDWIFPEAARVLTLKGAEIICHPSNIVLPYAFEAMKARAIENRIFIITANRTGEERGLTFRGKSQVVGPDMSILARSGKEEEEVRVAEVDLSLARNKKVTPKNDVIADRRPDFYKKILEG